jgi:hypothetical protein
LVHSCTALAVFRLKALSQVIPVFSRETKNAADYAGCRQNVMVSVVTLIIEKTMKK